LDNESISKGAAELAETTPGPAWQARGRRFESAMLHLGRLNSKLAVSDVDC